MTPICFVRVWFVQITTTLICLGSIESVSSQNAVQEATVFVTGEVHWSGTIEIKAGAIVNPGAVLTIEAGAVLRFTSASAVIVVKGTLIAIGRPDARIVFDGTDFFLGSAALFIRGATGVNVSYATFGNFTTVLKSPDPNLNGYFTRSIFFEDCVFEQNYNTALDLSGYNVLFLRCKFINFYNTIYGERGMVFDGCYFLNLVRQVCAFAGSLSVYVNCVFMNHTSTALYADDYSSVTNCVFMWNSIGVTTRPSSSVSNCLFVWNGIAVLTNGREPVILLDCIFLSNSVALSADDSIVSVIGGWMCIRPFDNTSDFIRAGTGGRSMEARGVWFGISGQQEAIIRGCIKDQYWVARSGLVDLINLADRPTAWPDALQPFNSTYAPLCLAPQDRGLDLLHPPSGVVIRSPNGDLMA
jgi:hypothetical protein